MKRAILFSGGGSFCARQVGLLHSIIEDNEDIAMNGFDTYAGVSGGALNAGFLQLTDAYMFADRVTELDQMWRSIEGNKTIYKKRLFGIKYLDAIIAMMTGSLYKPKPLKKMLEKIIKLDNYQERDSESNIYFGVVDFESGMYQELKPTEQNYINLMMASAAIPGAFPTVKIGESVYMDGGVRDNIPWKCVFREHYDEVYILMSRPAVSIQRPVRRRPSQNIFKVAARAIEIGLGEIHTGDIKRLHKLEEYGTKVKIYIPSFHDEALSDISLDQDPLNFNAGLIAEKIDDNKGIKPITCQECLELFPYDK